MKKIIFTMSLFTLVVSAHAGTFSKLETLRATDLLNSPAVDINVLLPEPARRIELQGNLRAWLLKSEPSGSTWPPSSHAELYLNGGITFEYKGEIISVKMGFKKGHYDTYVKNYKAKPVLVVSEVTDIVKSSDSYANIPGILYDICGEGERKKQYYIKGDYLEFACYGTGVYVSLVDQATQKLEFLLELPIRDLRQKWVDNAERYAMPFKGRTIYMVQQNYLDPEGMYNNVFGFILSESSPFYHTTGLPLDFMELYRYDSSTDLYKYKPVAYSIPLGIALEKSEQGSHAWNMREMTDDELSDALDDEALDTSRSR